MCLRASKLSKICLFDRPKIKFWKLFEIFFNKMASIFINSSISNTSFCFRHTFLLSACSSPSHAKSCLSLMSHHQVNNKCNSVEGRRWRWLIYALRIFLLRNNMLPVFRSNRLCSWKFKKFHRKIFVLESFFSWKWQNYIKTFVLHE